MAEIDGLAALNAKVDTLIRLGATFMVDRFSTQRERISFLSKAGLAPRLIAEILGTTTNTVSVSLSKMKKGSATDGEGKD